MGGGGGGGPFSSRTPEELAKQVRKAEEATSVAAFEATLSTMLAQLLGAYNGRDVDLVQNRLNEVKDALETSIEGTFDQLFGGSVAKRTFVDGLSDIDSLVIINDSDLEDHSPRRALDRMTKSLQRQLGTAAEISHGRMAVTIEYPDGMIIQLLPAISTEEGKLRVPSSRRDGWSHIDPTGFREALTRRNQECGGKLVPTIKLAKAIIGTLPESQRLSGYHMESLAIGAFRNYTGPKTTAAMLPTFFERAKTLVLSPIKDSTGQSVHVDEYLGPQNSEARLAASHILGRLEKRMRNATVANSTAQWQALFGLDE
jgi:Second Messenger Oligonucleotide or Dinucleotide Synthetase domain